MCQECQKTANFKQQSQDLPGVLGVGAADESIDVEVAILPEVLVRLNRHRQRRGVGAVVPCQGERRSVGGVEGQIALPRRDGNDGAVGPGAGWKLNWKIFGLSFGLA